VNQITNFKNKRILVTNDDGIYAPGLKVMEAIARELSDDVWVVAPEVEQSGAGHSLSIHTPLRGIKHDERRYAVRGTPTDCVLFAYEVLMEQKIDLILSGVNRGCNVAEDITHSGTVAAAMEGTLCGVPSIAMSQMFEMDATAPHIHWQTAQQHGAEVVQRILKMGIPAGQLMNVNFPDCPPEDVVGIRAVKTGRRNVSKSLETRHDRKGHPYYWLYWSANAMDDGASDTDLACMATNRISITPIALDLTSHQTLAQMQEAMTS